MHTIGTIRGKPWKVPRPSWDETFIGMAELASTRSSCIRRHVGAVAVDRGYHSVLSVGYNGTPYGMLNCDDGGCPRCNSDTPADTGYDRCHCVHAEQNVVAQAARSGVRLEGCIVYVTLRPCLPCLRLLVQIGAWGRALD
jgi:dCMP deaminase